MRTPIVFSLCVLSTFSSCARLDQGAAAPNRAPLILVDPQAEERTRNLVAALRAMQGNGLLFGHQETTLYGIGWSGDAERSDVKTATGSYPAVYGWDFFDLQSLRDPARARVLANHVVAAYERGGVNTFSWHMFNPVTGKDFYDTTPAVASILPGGAQHDAYKSDLAAIAHFAQALRASDGARVPIILRPFHEHNGSWFWWGKDHCTREEYIALWRFTVEYLRDVQEVHNLLYAYSPSIHGPNSTDYFDRYPGDAYVDILGFDSYAYSLQPVLPELRRVVAAADRRGKVAALTEAGYPDGLSRTKTTDYFTQSLLAPLKSDPLARRVAYVLVWRNAGKDHYWVPYRGDAHLPDFLAFYNDPFTVFEDTLPDMYAP